MRFNNSTAIYRSLFSRPRKSVKAGISYWCDDRLLYVSFRVVNNSFTCILFKRVVVKESTSSFILTTHYIVFVICSVFMHSSHRIYHHALMRGKCKNERPQNKPIKATGDNAGLVFILSSCASALSLSL